MKKYNTLLVVAITVLFVFLLTWILPITYLNGEFVTAERAQAGIADLLSYPIYTFYNFIYVLVYLLVVGGFYGILNRVKAYRLLLDKFVNFIKRKEIVFWILTVLVLSTIVAFTGFTYEIIIVLPFIASIIFLLGYDKMTVAMTMIGSVTVGIIGTLFSSLVAGSFNDILATTYTDLWITKLALLLVGSGILILNIILHNKKIKKTKSIEENIYVPEKTKSDAKTKLWPLITILAVFIGVFIISTLNWKEGFGVSIFATLVEKIQGFKIFDYTVLSRVLGQIKAFGEWSNNDYISLIILATLAIKFTYRVKFVEVLDEFGEGAKRFLYAAIIVLLSYTVLIVTSNHPVILTLLKPILSLTDKFNSVFFAFSTFISALFNSDFTYYQYAVFNLSYVGNYVTDTTLYPLCGLITQSMYGLALLVAPTSAVMLFSLTTLKISYLEWLKKIWVLFVELLALILIAIIVLMMFVI